jgi:hypothetical protein
LEINKTVIVASSWCSILLYLLCIFYPSVRKSDRKAPTGWIFMKFDIRVFFENLSRKFNFHQNLTRITGTLHKVQYTFLITSRSFLLTMRNVSDKICRENENTHFFVFKNYFSGKSFFYEVMWKSIVEPGRPQMTTWRRRIACWVTKATKYTLRVCNTYCFSTATMVTRTRLNITLYVHCLSRYKMVVSYHRHSLHFTFISSDILMLLYRAVC